MPIGTLRRVTAGVRDFEALLGGRRAAARRLGQFARKLPAVARGLRLTAKTDRTERLSIRDFLEHNARVRPDLPALLFEDRVYTHGELDREANRWANLLAGRGVRKGDAVALFVDNRPELLFAVAGIAKLGAIAGMINSRQHGHALEHSLRICSATCFVIGEEMWPTFAELGSTLDRPDRARLLWLADRGERPTPLNATDARAELARTSAAPPAPADIHLGDPCFYIYTSGTTGLPKASIMSHFRWTKGAGAFGMAALALRPDDVVYVPLPLYHSSALAVAWSATATTGATFALRRRFSVSAFWDDVRRFRATSFVYIGELCRYLLNQPPRDDDRNHTVRKIVGNGLRPDIWKQFKSRFAIDEVYEFYGASEGNIAFVNLLNADCTVGLCPAPYALVRYDIDHDEPVRGPDGRLQRVGRGDVGLLIAKVTPRYAFDGYTDPTANEHKLLRDVFTPGDCWFNSGDLLRDLGFRHAQFVDRVGDTFRWKGENVSTNEVAEVLNAFPQVAESTVYGVQLPGTDGRCGMVAVVPRVPISELDLAGLAGHLRAELPPYAVPLFLRIEDALEATTTFKQMKSELRRQGFDPARVGQPLYVLPPSGSVYVPLTDELHRAITDGKLAF